MFQIVFEQEDPITVRGMPFHTRPASELVSVSQDLIDLGCPNTSFDAALNWVTFTRKINFRLASRKPTKLISRTRREITITFEPAL